MPIEKGENGQGETHNVPKMQTPIEQQAVEQSGKIPPLNPIWERVAQVLAKQKAENPLPPKPPKPLVPADSEKQERKRTYDRGWKRQWRQKYPERHRQEVAKWQRSEKGKVYRAEWMRADRKRKKEAQTKEQGKQQGVTAIFPKL
jgi:hypothetical protein